MLVKPFFRLVMDYYIYLSFNDVIHIPLYAGFLLFGVVLSLKGVRYGLSVTFSLPKPCFRGDIELIMMMIHRSGAYEYMIECIIVLEEIGRYNEFKISMKI